MLASTCTALALAGLLGAGCSRGAGEFTSEFGTKDEQAQGGSSEGSTGGEAETGDPVEPDLPAPEPSCDLEQGELCPAGEGLKCVPDPGLGGFECVPVEGEGELGQACILDPSTNTDTCGADTYCFAGRCHALCGAGGACPQLGACWDALWVCVQGCDPLEQDCPGGLACMWTQDPSYGFQCGEPSGLGPGEPCLGSVYGSPCGPGLGCVPADQFPGDCGALPGGGCCNLLCDFEQGDQGCFDAPGETCLWAGLDSLPELGVCGGVSFQPGEIVITEVYADPPGVAINEAPLEYIEIYNASDRDIELGQLALDDFIGGGSDNILARFSVMGGEGGCQGGGSACLAPGRRALFISGFSQIMQTNGALVLEADSLQLLDAILQPWTRLKVFDENTDLVLSSARDWPDPTADPLPQMELPMHRVDLAGPDQPSNWVEAPPTPGL